MIELTGWGRYPRHASEWLEAETPAAVPALQSGHAGLVARGNGRAYGDAAIGERVTLSTSRLDRFRAFDPASGLLPFIQAGGLGEPGEGDRSVQAYNFRLCLTQDKGNQRPIEPPAGYDPARYEILARYLEALVAAGKTPAGSRLPSCWRGFRPPPREAAVAGAARSELGSYRPSGTRNAGPERTNF